MTIFNIVDNAIQNIDNKIQDIDYSRLPWMSPSLLILSAIVDGVIYQ